jgi:hypothetical protein
MAYRWRSDEAGGTSWLIQRPIVVHCDRCYRIIMDNPYLGSSQMTTEVLFRCGNRETTNWILWIIPCLHWIIGKLNSWWEEPWFPIPLNPSDFWPLISTTNGCHAELLVHLHLHRELVETSRASSGRIVVKMDADGLWMSWSRSNTSF